MRDAAVAHARGFAWENTADGLLAVYADALADSPYANVG